MTFSFVLRLLATLQRILTQRDSVFGLTPDLETFQI